MGIFEKLFARKPHYVSDISKIIKTYFVGKNPEMANLFQDDALSYAGNKANWAQIEDGLRSGKDAEYYGLIFVSLAIRARLLRGELHVFFGMLSNEGLMAYAMYCDCLDRIVAIKGGNKSEAEKTKNDLRQRLAMVG